MINKPLVIFTGILGVLCLTVGLYQMSRNIRTVYVPSNVEWYDTHINIPPGADYQIIFESGTWTNGSGDRTQALGKFGDDRKKLIVPGAYASQLVGKVGEEKFATGNNYLGTSTSGGRLYLSMNDRPNEFQDNEGQLKVSVEVK